MIVFYLCISLSGGFPACEGPYDNLKQCQMDGKFREYMYQRWMLIEWVCDKRTEL